ncbi:MAG: hypothetical protein FWJ66_06070 [Caldibacillus sp.]
MREQAYLKVIVKWTFVEGWEEVDPGELPIKVQEKLINYHGGE